MSQARCRWGILGAANIARKNWQALRLAENCTLAAVASRDLGRCRQFIAECQAHVPFDPPPRALASYEELLASPEIDAVYIPLPTAVRKPWVLRAAQAGKHVLTEKPVGTTAADVVEILDACRRHNVQLMDGVMFMHSRRLAPLRQVLDDGQTVGQITRVASQFCFRGSPEFFASNIRVHNELEPLGCLGDLGWYNIRFTLWALRGRLPSRVRGQMLASHGAPGSPGAVPVDFSAELFYPDGLSASFYCSFTSELQQWAHIGGTAGHVFMPDFVLPYFGSEVAFEIGQPAMTVSGCDFNMEPRVRRVAVSEYGSGAAQAQETNMFRTFAAGVLAGKIDPAWGQWALKTQQVLDACLQSAQQDGQAVELAG